jgi:hypothetical protein
MPWFWRASISVVELVSCEARVFRGSNIPAVETGAAMAKTAMERMVATTEMNFMLTVGRTLLFGGVEVV